MDKVHMDTDVTAQRNFLHELEDFVARDPARVFLRTPGLRTCLTRQAFAEKASRLAGALIERGMTRGATVGLLLGDRKSTRLNSSHVKISYAVFCLKKKRKTRPITHTREC